MLRLGLRLRAAGLKPALFGYSATFERFEHCRHRLERFIVRKCGQDEFIVVAHSLGSVLSRAALPQLRHAPLACFFLSPPTCACRAARFFLPRIPYRFLTREMGRLLADPRFMDALPVPNVPTRIYSGTAGPRGRWSPFGDRVNDGLLAVEETALPGASVLHVPSLHAFIMNSRLVATDMVATIHNLKSKDCGPGIDA